MVWDMSTLDQRAEQILRDAGLSPSSQVVREVARGIKTVIDELTGTMLVYGQLRDEQIASELIKGAHLHSPSVEILLATEAARPRFGLPCSTPRKGRPNVDAIAMAALPSAAEIAASVDLECDSGGCFIAIDRIGECPRCVRLRRAIAQAIEADRKRREPRT